MSLKKAYLVIFLVLLADQISKIYIKTSFLYDESVPVFSWFHIHFIENEGMAWGAKIPGDYGKLFLTLFRIVAVGGIGWWLWDSVQKKASNYLIVAVALIFAGALGNIIDSVFYGVIFSQSTTMEVAEAFSGDPYGTLFHGKVVDMLYFPLFTGTWPEWVPWYDPQNPEFRFFNAIFNLADTAISVGIGILIVFNKKAFHKHEA